MRRLNTIIAIFTVLSAAAAVSSALASPPAALEMPHVGREVTLLAHAETWSQSVCLGDLVEEAWLKSRCAVDRQTCCRWSLEGQREKRFTRTEIQSIVSRLDLGGFDLTIRGPEEITVDQSHRELTSNEIRSKLSDAATSKFGGEGSVATVTALHSPAPIYIPLGAEAAWDLVLPERLADKMTIKIVSMHDENPTLGWIQAGMSLVREVYTAKKSIRPGDALKPEDFAVSKADILMAQAAGQVPLSKGEFPQFVRARLSILKGAPLTTEAVERIPAVHLGDPVTLVLRSDSLRISTKGVAQGAAAVGDMVTVQLSRYNRTFRGRLREDKTVEVWL